MPTARAFAILNDCTIGLFAHSAASRGFAERTLRAVRGRLIDNSYQDDLAAVEVRRSTESRRRCEFGALASSSPGISLA